MVNSKEYLELPEILQQWIDRAASRIESPSRRDDVRKRLSIKFLDTFITEQKNVEKVLEKYGSAEEEEKKNEMINKLPDRNQWKVWRFVTIVCCIFVLISVGALCLMNVQALNAFYDQNQSFISSSVSNFAGGSTPSAVATRLVVFAVIAIITGRKTISEKKRSDNGYAEYEQQKPWAMFDGKPFA